MNNVSKRSLYNKEFIRCECNHCDEVISKYDKYGIERRFKKNHDKRHHFSEEHKKNLSIAHIGQQSWNKGKSKGYVNSDGYFMVMTKDGYVFEHRLVMELYLKCCLLPWCDVHHKNENRLDNRPENLEPMMHWQHTIKHYRGNQYTKNNKFL